MLCTPPRPQTRLATIALAAIAVAGCGGKPVVDDPVPGIALSQQRTIARSDLGFQWPFEVGSGTIACDGGALSFRSGSTTYALSRGAGTRGYANIDAIRRRQGSGPPSDPVQAVNQDVRMKIFAQASACAETAAGSTTGIADCKTRVAKAGRITDDDLTRIEAEGAERFWPPLQRPLMSLDPVIAAAQQLCPR